MESVFLILGSNLGESVKTLEEARVLIGQRIGVVEVVSPIYQSDAWGFSCEDRFYNQVVVCRTELNPEVLLSELLRIETRFGRRRTTTHGYESRTLDIDILYFGSKIIQTETLRIPHKHIADRRFVLLPLNAVAPDFVHPELNRTTTEMLNQCSDRGHVERFPTVLKSNYPYIAVEGVIGVGKTTLATMLSETFHAKIVLETFDTNPFLPKFYENPDKYAFPVELSFMAERFQQLQEQLIAPDLFHDCVVSDYITEKSLIFAGKTLPADVFELYSKLFHIIFATLPKPDLLVYLYANPEKLKQNIIKRGRDYEQNIELDYLAQLQNGYLEHFKNLKNRRVLIIDVNQLDFVANPADYIKILGFLQENYPVGISMVNNDEIF